ncbi:MAG: hypothetical protein M0R30_06265 [Methanoregula sp.]|uniref:hypothetical protein n=1 Tax=Methanoregula sp. TaxID=2052170 RepID=UPI0025D3E026|nr:hypothetical protein [Methanoregula sp.]MCK9631231.1 hypothetical protein [Methanoregula sp.]
MTDAVIIEHAESRHGTIMRYYQYGNGGVRVLDGGKVQKRLYRFDPSTNIMTEHDLSRQDTILRRFIFDSYGMLEETFAFGQPPRTFKYEAGAQRIAVREGGDYGAVGKLFTFEDKGVSETGWGRNGEIERVFVFESGDDAITIRSGGWFGNVDRTIVFERIRASVFREPEAFLQFLMFTEWSESEREEIINDEVAKIRGEKKRAPGQSPYAYTGVRHTPSDVGGAAGRGAGSRVPARASRSISDDPGIDFISDSDAPAPAAPRGSLSRQSASIPFEERRQQRDRDAQERYTSVRSDEIALQDRFERARSERGELSKGRSVEIPLEERFQGAREKEQLSRGGSVDIPLDERFESARREREKLSRGKSADIPYSERRGGRDR